MRGFCQRAIPDGLVKSGSVAVNVIPAQAGIQSFQVFLDSRLRGSDGSGSFYDVVIPEWTLRSNDACISW
jgi:hypothetical protein